MGVCPTAYKTSAVKHLLKIRNWDIFKSWTAVNILHRNKILVIGPEAKRETVIKALQCHLLVPNQIMTEKNLGVISASKLNSIPHIRNWTQIVFFLYHLCKSVHPVLSQANTEVLMRAIMSRCLDDCSALLSGLPKRSIGNLQSFPNSAARVLMNEMVLKVWGLHIYLIFFYLINFHGPWSPLAPAFQLFQEPESTFMRRLHSKIAKKTLPILKNPEQNVSRYKWKKMNNDVWGTLSSMNGCQQFCPCVYFFHHLIFIGLHFL